MAWYRPRTRVLIDNDFAGDPDGLFQLVHHALSPSVEIPVVISSHLGVGDFFDPSDRQADHGAAIAEQTLGVKSGGTTADGMFTVEDVECIAACTEAPCLQVNYRYRHKITLEEFDALIDDLRAGKLAEQIPPHGTLAKVRQHIPADRAAGTADPAGVPEPVWLAQNAEGAER